MKKSPPISVKSLGSWGMKGGEGGRDEAPYLAPSEALSVVGWLSSEALLQPGRARAVSGEQTLVCSAWPIPPTLWPLQISSAKAGLKKAR